MFTAIISGIVLILTALVPTTITATVESAALPAHAGIGTATIDGIVEQGEWDEAASTSFFLLATDTGEMVPATLYSMNDESNLYVALVVERGDVNFSEIATLYLDHNNNANLDDGDDALRLSRTFSASSAQFVTRFVDSYGAFCDGEQCELQLPDVEDGGTNDGAGAVVNDGTSVVFEWVHPLNSPDMAHDALLAVGKKIQLRGNVSLLGTPIDEAVAGNLPTLDVFIVPADAEKIVAIDLQPHANPNELSLRQMRWATVAVLSSERLAADSLQRKSLTFGRTGDERSVRRMLRFDVNGDGLRDLVLLVQINKTGLQTADNVAILKGLLADGTAVLGLDTVIIHP
ncbi:MAG: hypothetical protein KC423_22000 [Anaerolineales bacterium]|nr:hypothetical protein [Anaerolineales bacterium]